MDFAAPDAPQAGLGPELRRAAAARLGRPPSPEDLAAFVEELLPQPLAGYVYPLGTRKLASFFPRPDLGEPLATFPTFFQALDLVLEERLGAELARERIAQVERALARRERALAALAEAEREAQGWPALQSQADLILTRLGEIPRGVAEAVVEGFDGQPVRLSLNPAVPPLAHAQALYARARKLRRRLEEVPARREKLQKEIARLQGLREALQADPALAPYLVQEEKSPRSEERVRAAPREVVHGGFRILVGRSAEENERILRLARPGDLWLHARGVPGAHVIVRTDGRPVPEEVLRRAAELAAWHSRARGERKVEVSYTDVRYVRKPKGAPPGMVTLLREEVLVVPGDQGL
ncbi:MAG: NFACT RNA binding domain-containing protein [Candidatus Bipolaricaulota bacterium]|nr:NFACT RNA binding domain-containing protein [Candidatus Bipolaricaulota bacterium]